MLAQLLDMPVVPLVRFLSTFPATPGRDSWTREQNEMFCISAVPPIAFDAPELKADNALPVVPALSGQVSWGPCMDVTRVTHLKPSVDSRNGAKRAYT